VTPATRTPPSSPGRRIRQEQATIAAMMRIYCRDLHGGRDALCDDCARLLDYARRRLDNCPFQEDKPVCNRCAVHCYSESMRERVRAVMRYAGPRMTWRYPWLSLLHLLDKLRAVPQLRRRRRPQTPD
jgi:hypothetical protein